MEAEYHLTQLHHHHHVQQQHHFMTKMAVLASMEDVPRAYPNLVSRSLSATRGEYTAMVSSDVPVEHLVSEIYLNLLNLGRKLTLHYHQQGVGNSNHNNSNNNLMDGLLDMLRTKFKTLVPSADQLVSVLAHSECTNIDVFSDVFYGPINYDD